VLGGQAFSRTFQARYEPCKTVAYACF